MDLSGVTGFHEIIVLTPRGFEEGLDAVMAVREQRTVLLNLSEMEANLLSAPLTSFQGASMPYRVKSDAWESGCCYSRRALLISISSVEGSTTA